MERRLADAKGSFSELVSQGTGTPDWSRGTVVVVPRRDTPIS